MRRFFTAVHKQRNICLKSSSGGAFTAITDAWFSTYGEHSVIYGCAFDENLNVKHIRGTNAEDRDRMRGSNM